MGGFSAVGGMAVFPEQNVHFGRGPSAVDVIWVAIGSNRALSWRVHCVRMGVYYSGISEDQSTSSLVVDLAGDCSDYS